MSIWDRVKLALEPLGVPVAANTWMAASGGVYPDTYLVYLLVSSPPRLHADDTELARAYRIQVSAYSRSGLTNLPDVAGAMVAAGFTRSGIRELPYNSDTRHFGLAMDFIYLEDNS